MNEILMYNDVNFEAFETARTIDSLLIWTRINNIQRNFQAVKNNFLEFVTDIGTRASKEWQKYKKKKFETPEEKVLFLSDAAKEFKKQVLMDLSSQIFDDLWYLRAETELIVATFHFGFISDYVERDLPWEEKILSKLRPLVLRMKIPSKTNLPKYSLNTEVKKMLHVITAGFEDAEKLIAKIPIPADYLKREKELIKRHEANQITDDEFKNFKDIYQDPEDIKKLDRTYRYLFRLREELTKLTQACAPR